MFGPISATLYVDYFNGTVATTIFKGYAHNEFMILNNFYDFKLQVVGFKNTDTIFTLYISNVNILSQEKCLFEYCSLPHKLMLRLNISLCKVDAK